MLTVLSLGDGMVVIYVFVCFSVFQQIFYCEYKLLL